MKSGPRFALLLSMAALLGCGLPPTPSSPGAWQNWQIQAGTAITSPPNTYPSFLGATQVLGTQAAGVFTTVATAATTGPPLDYTGSFNSSTGDVTLATFGFGFGYILPATPYTLVPVGVTGGCVYPPGYTGVMCNAIFAVPAVGVQIAPLNGTYTGTLTDSATPSMSGTATLTLTQSTTPNSSGAFPLTGTLTFPSSSNLGTSPLGGTVSGEGIALSYYSAAVIGPGITLTASTNPIATQITISNLTYLGGGTTISATFTGTLTLQ